MALVIRLRQQGKSNRRFFRLVVCDERGKRDGKFLEKLGWYDPHASEDKSFFVEKERVLHWIQKGARISDKAKVLVKKQVENKGK